MPMLRTHHVFSITVAVVLYGAILREQLAVVGAAAFSAFLADTLIDMLGHTRLPNGIPARTPRTHSVFTGPLWGLAAGLPAGLIFLRVSGDFGYLVLFGLAGVLAACGHLFLDAGTNSGIYGPTGHRWAYAHISSQSMALNGLISCGSLLTIALSFPVIVGELMPGSEDLALSALFTTVIGQIMLGAFALGMLISAVSLIASSVKSKETAQPHYHNQPRASTPALRPPVRLRMIDEVTTHAGFSRQPMARVEHTGAHEALGQGAPEDIIDLSGVAYCYRCGFELAAGEAYCSNCGTPRDQGLALAARERITGYRDSTEADSTGHKLEG